MPRINRFSVLGGILLIAACAHAVSTGQQFAPGGDNAGDDGGAGGTGPNGTVRDPSGGPGGPTITFVDAAKERPSDDGAPQLSDNGSVGQCVVDRTCDAPKCDELQEGGQHEYIEQHPDDGSQIPAKTLATAQALFQAAPSTVAGPCIVEPPDGALFPNNWARARIRVKTAAGAKASVYQIKIHADRQANDLIVYTESPSWRIPKDIWQKLAASTWDEPITVTVSAAPPGGGAVTSSQVRFVIAPALANGSIIYWAAAGKDVGQAWLESFSVGDENVAVALTAPQTKWRQARQENGGLQTRAATAPLNLPAGAPACVGCHVAVPDRQSVTFVEDWPWDGVASMVDPADTGNMPSWLTVGGAEALSMPWLGMMTFSPHVWNDLKQHIMVVAMQNESVWGPSALDGGVAPSPFPPWGYQSGNEWDQAPASQLGWVDLSSPAPSIFAGGVAMSGDQASLAMAANYGTSWGVMARTGDTSGVASPTWSHLKGDTVVYASTNASRSGREGPGVTNIKGFADLYSVPYNAGAGGIATPIPGASDPAFNEYYPSYSPDDKFIAFNRLPAADDMYYAPRSQVYVIPSTGGTPTPLKANDAPACMNVPNPGITNSWAKWAPEYPSCGGSQYYWLIFSSTREQIPFLGGSSSQLYLTAVVKSEAGLSTYPGVFIWNQHLVATGVPPYDGKPQSNHTPQWEGIDLPVPPPPPPPPPAQQPPM
jgi:hypothetical protein